MECLPGSRLYRWRVTPLHRRGARLAASFAWWCGEACRGTALGRMAGRVVRPEHHPRFRLVVYHFIHHPPPLRRSVHASRLLDHPSDQHSYGAIICQHAAGPGRGHRRNCQPPRQQETHRYITLHQTTCQASIYSTAAPQYAPHVGYMSSRATRPFPPRQSFRSQLSPWAHALLSICRCSWYPKAQRRQERILVAPAAHFRARDAADAECADTCRLAHMSSYLPPVLDCP